MMRVTAFAALFSLSFVFPFNVAVGPPQARAEQDAAAEEALLGFDPIELIGGREVLGEEELAVEHGGVRYLFVSAANRDLFLSDPARYGIQLGGLCARLGRTVAGEQDLYRVFDGRIYLLASNHCVEVFEAAPERFMEPERAPALGETAPAAALQRGGELIDLAVAALGGAAAIDEVDTFVEELVTLRPNQGDVAEMPQTVALDFSHRRMLHRRSFTQGDLVEVWTPEASWRNAAGTEQAYSPAQAANLAEELVIANPLYILGLRDQEGFVAASRGQGSAEVLEHVDVEWGEQRWVLGIEPRTGYLASVSFTDRGPEGNWGEVTHLLDDYRAVGAVRWPHRRVVTFDGEMVPWWNTTTRALRLNEELPADLFTRGSSDGGR